MTFHCFFWGTWVYLLITQYTLVQCNFFLVLYQWMSLYLFLDHHDLLNSVPSLQGVGTSAHHPCTPPYLIINLFFLIKLNEGAYFFGVSLIMSSDGLLCSQHSTQVKRNNKDSAFKNTVLEMKTMIEAGAYFPKAAPASIYRCGFQEKTTYTLNPKKLVKSHMNCTTGLFCHWQAYWY